MSEGALSGLTVVDLTRALAGPYCTLVLGDMGARVIKVEPPGTGDDARHVGPFINGKSAYFMSLNRGKQSIALDLKAAGGRAVFEALLERADVLVENYRPGVMERLGYAWAKLHRRYPRLVYAAVSGFGQSGPYARRPAYDMVVQGMGGIMSITGQPGGPPTRVGASIGDITAGLYAAIGINGALMRRAQSGEGSMVDVAMLDCQIALMENAIARHGATGETPGPLGSRHPSVTPFEAFATTDGHVIIAAGNDTAFRRLCATLDCPELTEDPRFATRELRHRNRPALKAVIDEKISTGTTAAWLEILEQGGVPAAPINNVPQAMADPQVAARTMIARVDDPVAGPIRVTGNPIKISGVDDPATRDPAPELDGDRAAILEELGLDVNDE